MIGSPTAGLSFSGSLGFVGVTVFGGVAGATFFTVVVFFTAFFFATCFFGAVFFIGFTSGLTSGRTVPAFFSSYFPTEVFLSLSASVQPRQSVVVCGVGFTV